MRGKAPRPAPLRCAIGITPAHAGKSEKNTVVVWSFWDHPRTCGEKGRHETVALRERGSPPHMRGKGICILEESKGKRITPAHAGKRKPDNGQKSKSGDHPRTCGEKSQIASVHSSSMGSPPHMRGKDVFGADGPGWTRITPAHAGKSKHWDRYGIGS